MKTTERELDERQSTKQTDTETETEKETKPRKRQRLNLFEPKKPSACLQGIIKQIGNKRPADLRHERRLGLCALRNGRKAHRKTVECTAKHTAGTPECASHFTAKPDLTTSLWARIEKNTDEIAIQSFTVPQAQYYLGNI